MKRIPKWGAVGARVAGLAALAVLLAAACNGTAPVRLLEGKWQDTAFQLLHHFRAGAETTPNPVVLVDAGAPGSNQHAADTLVDIIDLGIVHHVRAIALDMQIDDLMKDYVENPEKSVIFQAMESAAEVGIPVIVARDDYETRHQVEHTYTDKWEDSQGSHWITYSTKDLPRGVADWVPDMDGYVRSFHPTIPGADGKAAPTFAAATLSSLGIAPAAALIDFSALAPGEPLSDIESGRLSKDSIMLVGHPPEEDRTYRVSTRSGWDGEPGKVPGILLDAHVLRAFLTGQTVSHNTWAGYLAALVVACALFALRLRVRYVLALPCVLGILFASAVGIGAQVAIDTVLPVLTVVFALVISGVQAQMGARLERRRLEADVQRLLPREAVRHLFAAGERAPLRSERRINTILFVDLRGYTDFSIRHEMEVVRRRLDDYFATIIPVIENHGGEIMKFIGDAAMARFEPVTETDDASRAVLAGLELVGELARMNDALVDGAEPLRASVGIARGEVHIGGVGSQERYDFSAFGPAVNLSAHLQQLCREREAEMIVDLSVWEHAQLPESMQSRFEVDPKVLVPKHGTMYLVELRSSSRPARAAATASMPHDGMAERATMDRDYA